MESELKPIDCLIVIEATPQMDGTWWVGGSTFLDESAPLSWVPDTPEARAELRDSAALRAELEKDRGRLEWCIRQLSALNPYICLLELYAFEPPDFMHAPSPSTLHDIPAGQTARDVIDRLIGEAGDAS